MEKYGNSGKGGYFRFDDGNNMSYRYILSITYTEMGQLIIYIPIYCKSSFIGLNCIRLRGNYATLAIKLHVGGLLQNCGTPIVDTLEYHSFAPIHRYSVEYSLISDIDECADDATNNCDADKMLCENTVGGYECDCEDGYRLEENGTCAGGWRGEGGDSLSCGIYLENHKKIFFIFCHFSTLRWHR